MNFLKEVINCIKNLDKKIKIIAICGLCLLLLIIIPIIWYKSSIGAISKESEDVPISIELGSGIDSIANVLYNQNVIKSKTAFKIYVKLNNVDGLQAGDYLLNKNMDVYTIIENLKTGKVQKEQTIITFVEGKNIDSIAKTISEKTNFTKDDVYTLLNDTTYIDSLIEEYWFLTEDIKNKDIYYSLEGYLYPETYYFETNNLELKTIFKSMLDETKNVLEELNIDKESVSVHEILTMASIVELESSNVESKKDVASVFYNRLNSGMSLGSDVTTYYAFKINMSDRDLTVTELNTYNPYNTRGPKMSGKLPVGPICSPSKTSIEAALNPNTTSYLYFVADKNGKVYFADTYAKHEEIVQNLKDNNLWFEY